MISFDPNFELSLVVPTHGRIELFRRTLESITRQETDRFELVVSDDSSATRDQQEIQTMVEDYHRRTGREANYVFTQAKLGQAANTNQGLKAARGKLIRILHSDDLLAPHALSWETNCFRQIPSLELLFSDAIPFESDDRLRFNKQPHLRLVNARDHFRESLAFQTALPSGLVLTRALLEHIGYMREDWRFLCDWEFFGRLILEIAKTNRYAGYATAGTYGWRVHSDSTTGRYWQDHYREHQLLMEAWSEQLPCNGDLFLDQQDLQHFLRQGNRYRSQRLWQDAEQLGWSDKWKNAAWLAKVCIEDRNNRKFALRQLTSNVKRLVSQRKHKTHRFGLNRTNEAEPIGVVPDVDIVITPLHEHCPVKSDLVIVAPYDNSLNLWSVRDKIAEANRICIRHLNFNRFFQRTLVETLKHVRQDTEVVFSFHDNDRMTWFGLKALVVQHFPGCFELVEQSQSPSAGTQQGLSQWEITYRCVQPVPAYYREALSGFTIGVLTMGNRNDLVDRLIESVQQHCPVTYEILMVVPEPIEQFAGNPNVRQIVFDHEDPYGWITRKKNLLCQEAQFSDIVICHDRFEFTNDFFSRFNDWGHSYGIAAARIELPDGKRALDWGTVRGENISWCRGGLLNYRDYSAGSYVPGGITMIRKRFWESCPWDESLFWNEHEDVELCRRAQRSGQIIYNFPGKVRTATDRWVDENPIVPFDTTTDCGFVQQ